MVYYYYIYGNNNLEVIIIIIKKIVCLRPVTLANQAHAFSVETAHRNNLVAQWNNKYHWPLIQSRYAANYDTKFLCCYVLIPNF